MDIFKFIRIILNNIKLLLLLPIIATGLMYYLTKNNPSEYSSKALIFTGITSSTSLENLGNSRVDYFATTAAYNNLLSILSSRAIQQETSLRMLAGHLMLDEADNLTISKKSYDELMKIVPPEIINLVDKHNAEVTYQNLLSQITQKKDNFIYGLLNFDHPYYSYKAISNVQALRKGGSDVIELIYTNTDPCITYQTLNILISVFLDNYSMIKQNQTGFAVEYFERQLAISAEELDAAEDELLKFNKSNEIINYYEQTKHISSQQEKIQVRLQDLLMEYRAAEAVLKKLETETASRFNINLQNTQLMDIRKALIIINEQIADSEIEDLNSSELNAINNKLYNRKSILEKRLENALDSLYVYSYNSEGIDIETLLNDWLKTVIDYESSKARLSAMQQKEEEFNKLYGQYAPLGAILKRIERGIEVKERAYLELLHHLGLARLRQQNENMMANMKLIDPPQLPINPKPGKRKVMLLIIALATFVFVLLALFMIELLDKRIKSIINFQSLIRVPVKNAIPNTLLDKEKILENLHFKGIKHVVENIRGIIVSNNHTETIVVQLISNLKKEGKTHVAQILKNQLNNNDINVVHICFEIDSCSDTSVLVENSFQFSNYQELIYKEIKTPAEVVIIEVPSLSEYQYNKNLFKHAAMSYFIADANRTWSMSDVNMLENLMANKFSHLEGLLNKVSFENMESLIGEIPKKRSKFRKYIKNNIIKRFVA